MREYISESELFAEVSQKIEDGVDLDAPLDVLDSTYLHYASSNNYTEVITLLLDSGASIDQAIYDGDTALNMAANLGHKEAVELLLSRGANINHQSPDGGVTPLIDAIINRHSDIVKLLLGHNPKLDIIDGLGQSALIIAIKRGELEIAKSLISAGIDINNLDFAKSGPVNYAVIMGDVNLLELLIKKGAKLDSKSLYGNTLLHDVVQSGFGQLLNIAKKYFYTQINEKNLFGNTPFNQALISQNYEAIQLFAKDISAGAIRGLTRNEACPCGSGKKFKKCCLGKDQNEIIENAERFTPQPFNEPINDVLTNQLAAIGLEIDAISSDKIVLSPKQYLNNKMNQEIHFDHSNQVVNFTSKVSLNVPNVFIEPVEMLVSMLNKLSRFSMTTFNHSNGLLEYVNSASFDQLSARKILLPQLIHRNQYCVYKTFNAFNKLNSFGKAYFTSIMTFVDEFTPNKKIREQFKTEFNDTIGIS